MQPVGVVEGDGGGRLMSIDGPQSIQQARRRFAIERGVGNVLHESCTFERKMNDICLDRMDMRIISALRKDGRISHQQLSAQVGLSPSQCLRRVKKLEELGVIRGYTAIIDESKLGNDVSAWIIVTLHRNKPGARERVALLLQNRPWVRLATGITGDVDFMIRVVAPRMADFTKILVDELSHNPDISSTQSFICLDNLVGN